MEQEKRATKQKLKKEGGRGGIIQKRTKTQKKENDFLQVMKLHLLIREGFALYFYRIFSSMT